MGYPFIKDVSHDEEQHHHRRSRSGINQHAYHAGLVFALIVWPSF